MATHVRESGFACSTGSEVDGDFSVLVLVLANSVRYKRNVARAGHIVQEIVQEASRVVSLDYLARLALSHRLFFHLHVVQQNTSGFNQ